MDSNTWNTIVTSFPEPHILQTWQWGQLKSHFGWQPFYKIWGSPHQPAAAALILQRSIRIGGFGPRLRILYAPKGPLLQNWGDAALRAQVFTDLRIFARQQGAIFIKIDPDVPLGVGVPGTETEQNDPLGAAVLQNLDSLGWRYAPDQIQFRNTVLISLAASEENLLAQMKQKTRYNIRLAGRKGVTLRVGTPADFEMLYQMYAENALRDGFAIRSADYYQKLWQIFFQAQFLTPLIAEVAGQPVSGLMLFRFGGQAYYIHGMSRPVHRNKMPTYLLQWEAIRHAKAAGCDVYDLWGAPESFAECDSMWGVFRFKQGLGGEVRRTIGAYDLPMKPLIYKLYTQILPRILDQMRRKGKNQTQAAAASTGQPG